MTVKDVVEYLKTLDQNMKILCPFGKFTYICPAYIDYVGEIHKIDAKKEKIIGERVDDSGPLFWVFGG